MAQIDSSIYLQQQSPDFLGSFQQGMNLRQMADQRSREKEQYAKQKSIDDAYKAGVVQGEDGSFSQNRGLTLSSLSKADPRAAMEQDSKWKAEDLSTKKNQMEQQLKRLELTGQLLGSSVDQNSYTNSLMEAKKYGIDTAGLPEQFDPKLVSTLRARSLSAKDQIDNELKKQNYDILQKQNLFDNTVKMQELGLKKQAADEGANIGQKTVDKEFAKDYNDWTSGGAKIARSEINKLENVLTDLKDKKVTTGGLTGMFPDRMTSDNLLRARSDVQSTVMNSLKSIMGSAFTEKEGERVIKNTWNEADTTENNLARLTRLVSDLKNQANDKDSKAGYFKNTRGTLGGFEPSSTPAAPKSNYVKKFTDDNLNKMSDAELALLLKTAKGGK